MKQTRQRDKHGWRSRFGVIILSVVALCLVIIAGILFTRLIDSERQMDAIVREDAMWAVFQTDRHLRQLHATSQLLATSRNIDLLPEVLRDYNVLYSRVNLLERGTFFWNLAENQHLPETASRITAFVVSLAPHMDSLQESDPLLPEKIAALAAEFAEYIPLTNSLLLGANAAINQMRVDDRVARAELQDQLALLAVALVFAFIGIFLLLMMQMRRIAFSNQHMRLLRERSRRQAERAQAASRAKSAFLATMSHEIRTPLNGVIGSADLLALQDLPEKSAQTLRMIQTSAALLRDLINSILDFSNLESGIFERREVETDLSKMAETIKAAFHIQAVEKNIDFKVDLPAFSVLTCDVRLTQVLLNLVGNAMKFTHKGEVRVSATYDAELLRFEIQDSGIGISQQHQEILFQRFTQVDDRFAREYGGSGLGLARCKQIVTALDGRIGVESELGVGSIFWFEIPVKILPPQLVVAEGADEEIRKIGKKRVLVVEDNKINADVVTGMLTHLGHSVEVARNGLEGTDAHARFEPDLILMDMQMPVMDGLEATRAIRANGSSVPIIALTANAFEQDRLACMKAGMSDFLSKPVTLEALDCVLKRQAYVQGEKASGLPNADIISWPKHRDDDREVEALTSRSGTASADHAQGFTPINQQLSDLVAALGNDVAMQLVTRFGDELADVEADLRHAMDGQDAAMMDDLLHTFKGAALTLGMQRSGEAAQELRQNLPLKSSDLQRLIALAREDERLARLSLGTIEAA